MAGKTRAILRRVKSVKSTRKITRAMEMVAAAKLKTAQRRSQELRGYAERTLALLQAAVSHKEAFHPLLAERPVQKTAIVLLSSDRGLCGAYNSNVIREGLRVWSATAGESGGFLSIGAKGRAALRRRNLPHYRELSVETGKPTWDDARMVTDALVQLFEKRTVDRVLLVYTEFLSPMVHRPVVRTLLPLSTAAAEPDRSHALFWEPGPKAVIDRLVPMYLATMVYRALLDASASEFAARRMAMKAATDNASEMIEKLTLQYNQARQAAITQEIAEIVGGAAALE